MKPEKNNSDRPAHLGLRPIMWLFAATVTFLAARTSSGAVSRSGVPARSADNSGLPVPAAGNPSTHLCGRDDCPVSTDAAGNMWCWCRTVDVRDLCD